MTRKVALLVAALFCLGLSGCSVRLQELDDLKAKNEQLQQDVNNLTMKVNTLQGEVGDNPELFLARMDRDLDAISEGRQPKGSFSDYFLINAEKAVMAGATKKEVMARIDRLVGLASQGKYLSESEIVMARGNSNVGLRKSIVDDLFPQEEAQPKPDD